MTLSTSRFYKFFSNCILVKGKQRAAICDLQRHDYFLVPNGLAAFITDGYIDRDKAMESLDVEDRGTLDEYIQFLLGKEVLFPCEEELLAQFPPLSLHWDYPAVISNALLDGDRDFAYFNKSLLAQLTELGCCYLEFRCYQGLDRTDWERVLNLICNSQIKSIDVIIPFEEEPSFLPWVQQMTGQHKKIRSINMHGAPVTKIIQNQGKGNGIIAMMQECINSEKNCGCISSLYFCITTDLFTESQAHNNCLNRKIGIDRHGFIRNCPSMPQHFGHVSTHTLGQAIASENFNRYSNIRKDEIEVCRECEFRYICTDCRAYTEQPEHPYSKPLKCGYDPSTCTWEDWSTHPAKQKAMQYYQL